MLSLALDLCIVSNGIGAITCILIFEGDFVPSVLASPPWQARGLAMDRRVAVVAVAAAAYPLTLPADISALRYTSVIVPVVLLATIVIVWCQLPEHYQNPDRTDANIVWWDFNLSRWLQAVPLMVN